MAYQLTDSDGARGTVSALESPGGTRRSGSLPITTPIGTDSRFTMRSCTLRLAK